MIDREHVWTVVMAGGLGSRFWPVSQTDNPKQFIDVVGVGRSMLQLTFERFERICPRDHIIIVTGEAYVSRVREQLPGLKSYQVLAEPLRRNTAPCVAYAAAIIRERDAEATLIVSPADHAVFRKGKFQADMEQAVETAQQHDWIITLGAQPTRPDTSYGYIQFRENPSLPDAANLHKVVTFTEKPPVAIARQMIASGEFFWNTGLLVMRMPVLLDAYRRHLPDVADVFFRLSSNTAAEDLAFVYSRSEAISIDHGIMEKADNVHVLAASFNWSDVETWDSLYDISRRDRNDNAIYGGDVFTYDTRNCLVVTPADQDKTIVLEGLDGYIVAASEDTLMICRRKSEEMVFRFASDVELKKLIDKKKQQ
ncbi:MAG: mannose-1-phosphate guanylyltransferase [Bacteroidales bacterium]|nr:mannose-1-phosphate guanylyltransferase [Bacteroidales bacterium]